MSRRRSLRVLLAVAAGALMLLAVVVPSVRSDAEGEPVHYVIMTRQDARETFGVGDRHGEDSVDVYAMEYDPSTEAGWASLHPDQPERAQIDPAQVREADGTYPGDDSTIAVTLSRYERPRIDGALDEVRRIVEENGCSAAFSYSPVSDSIRVEGDPTLGPLLGESVDGVQITFTEAEISLG